MAIILRNLIIVIILIVLSIFISSKYYQKKRMILTGYATEYGCLTGHQNACSFISDEINRGNCLESALTVCPKISESFINFLENK
jgi:hypothetical protein